MIFYPAALYQFNDVTNFQVRPLRSLEHDLAYIIIKIFKLFPAVCFGLVFETEIQAVILRSVHDRKIQTVRIVTVAVSFRFIPDAA